MDLAEFANKMSNILCGFGEAPEEEMIERAEELMEVEKNYRLIASRELIIDAIENLKETIEDIENDYKDPQPVNQPDRVGRASY